MRRSVRCAGWRRAARIVAISACVADTLAAISRAAPERTTLVYNGVDRERFRPQRSRDDVRAEFGVPADATVIGTVGQLVPWKRQDLFLEAAAHILAHLPQTWFLVVGADLFGEHAAYVAELRALAAGLSLGDRAVFTGYREDVAAVMAAMDLMLHPAEEEPLGRAVLEAMSLGVPCVAADACGPAEIIEDGISGILTPPGDAQAMAARAVELLSRPRSVQRMGEAAMRRVETASRPSTWRGSPRTSTRRRCPGVSTTAAPRPTRCTGTTAWYSAADLQASNARCSPVQPCSWRR